jgi:hypothetical protein
LDSNSKLNTPRAELNKFDGSSIIEWLEDYEFYFDIYNTVENYKVKTIVTYLVGEVREWFRYFKLHSSDSSWVQFKEELLDRFDINSKDSID